MTSTTNSIARTSHNHQEPSVIDRLAGYGLGFTHAYRGEKRPWYKAWQHTPKTATETYAHALTGNVGVLLGEYADRRFVAFDVDSRFDEFLATFPQLGSGLLVTRGGSDGGKVIVEVADTMPPNATWGQHGDHKGADLLAAGRHAIIMGCHPSGNAYQVRPGRPVVLTHAEIAAIWQQWTGETLGERKCKEPTAPRAQIVMPSSWTALAGEELRDQVRRAWPAYAVFAHFGYATDPEPEGDDIRLRGHAGLLVGDPNGPEPGRWFWHGQDAGGDAFDAWAICTRRDARTDFRTILHEMANAAGIAVTVPKEQQIAAHDVLAYLREWAHTINFAEWLTARTSNGQYRTYATDLAAFDAVVELLAEHGKLYGPLSGHQVAARINASPHTGMQALERLCTGLMVRIERERPTAGAFTYQLAPAVIDVAVVAVRRSRVNSTSTAEHARSTHKPYQEHRADDAFCASLTPLTADQVAERVAMGQPYGHNYRRVLDRRLAAIIPSAGRMVLVLLDELQHAGAPLAVRDLADRRGRSRFTWRRAVDRALELSLVAEEEDGRLTVRADWEEWIARLETEMPTAGTRRRRAIADCDRRLQACERMREKLKLEPGHRPPAWVEQWESQAADLKRRIAATEASESIRRRWAEEGMGEGVVRPGNSGFWDLKRRVTASERVRPAGPVHDGPNGRVLYEQFDEDEAEILLDLATYRAQLKPVVALPAVPAEDSVRKWAQVGMKWD